MRSTTSTSASCFAVTSDASAFGGHPPKELDVAVETERLPAARADGHAAPVFPQPRLVGAGAAEHLEQQTAATAIAERQLVAVRRPECRVERHPGRGRDGLFARALERGEVRREPEFELPHHARSRVVEVE